MMKYLTRPRDVFPDPSSMDQASLAEELEPGALKDEMLKDFDPSQETYEEYLQRKNLVRPFNMAEGGQLVAPSVDGSRPGYAGKKYNWTTINGVKYPVFIEGPNKGKINWRTTKTVDGKIKEVYTPISKEDLIAQFKKGRLDKIQGAVYSIKDANQIRADLPEGITLSKQRGTKGAYTYRVSWIPRGQDKKQRIWLPATEDNIEDLIKRQKVYMKKNYPNILSNEAFENLRMNDENINLTKKQFAEKLNKLGHKTYHNLAWTGKNVSGIEEALDIHKLTNPEKIRIRSISEAKNIIRSKKGGNVRLKDLMKIEDKGLRDAEIRRRANIMLGEEYTRKKMGIFAHTNTKEAQMFKNWFAASKTGYSDRIQIGGKFDGKDLRHRRNWPKNLDGSVNWTATGKDGKPAWQSVEFTDTKVPDGKGGFKETKFTWDKTVKNGNIGQQVDNTFGSGFFNKSTKAYDLQKLGSTKNVMFRGKSMPVSQAIAEKMIIDQYKLDNKGRMPTEDTIKRRRQTFSYDEVHHPRGIGNDPYFTENSFRTANRELNYAEKTYKGKIAQAEGNPRLLSEAKKNYIKNIEDISGKYGGIRAEVDGKMVGTKGTHASITAKAIKTTGLDKLKDFKPLLKKLLTALCPRGGSASGGRIGFQSGTPTVACGAKFLEARIKDGKGSPAQRTLMADIIAAGSKLKKIGGALLNPIELLNLKNWVGPQALALMGAFEVGDVTYDTINNNKPIKEALGDNWILRYASPYNREELSVEAVEKAKIKGSPAMQNYMKKVKMEAEIEREHKKLQNLKTSLEGGSKSPDAVKKAKAIIEKQEAVVNNSINNYKKFDKATSVKGASGNSISTLESGKQDFEKAFGTIIEKRQAGEWKPGFSEDAFRLDGQRKINTEGKYVNTGSDWADSGDLSHITGQHPYKYKIDLGADQSRNMSETERKAQKLFPFEKGSITTDYTKPTYKDFNYIPQKLPNDRRQDTELRLTERGILPPRTSLSEVPLPGGRTYDLLKYLTDDYNFEQKSIQARNYPGYIGTQEPAKYSEGGITTLRSKYEYKK